MAYFPNSTSAELYQEEYCERCIHWTDNGSGSLGCPIMDAHFMYCYELCNQKQHPGKVILDMLIPDDKERCQAAKCNFFVPNGECNGQEKMFKD